MYKWYNFLIFGFLLLTSSTIFYACEEKPKKNRMTHGELKAAEEKLIEANKTLTQAESARIDAFCKRKKWPVNKTGTGLRYYVYEDGEGDLIQKDNIVTLEFGISLLDGTLCYSSKENGAQSFKVGMDDVESGLHEAMTYLKKGDKARLVLPPHLAHGLVGDQNKIPSNASLVYDIEVLEVQ